MPIRPGLLVAYLLAAGLTTGSLLALAATPDLPFTSVHVTPSTPAMLGLLAVGFCLAELGLVHVEFRRQAYSYALAGLPLAVGLCVLGPREVVVARLIGSSVAFAIQRPATVKIVYNNAAYAFEAAVDGYLLSHLAGTTNALTVSHAAALGAIVAGVDLTIGLLVFAVIKAQGNQVSRTEMLPVLLSAFLFSFASTILALISTLTLEHGWLGASLLACCALIATIAHHSYRILHRRHQALAMVHDFVEHSDATANRDVLAGRLLIRTGHLLAATRTEVMILGDEPAWLLVDEAEEVQARPLPVDGPDWLLRRALEQNEPILVKARPRDRGLREWLHTHGASDAMVVPLALPDHPRGGLLLVFDRLGDTSTFTPDDLTLLQTLAGHMSVALQNARLVQRLRHEATHDVLTDLANRALLSANLDIALANGGPAALFMLDLDRFKEVNDALGHHVGDELLKIIGARLTDLLPPTATVARLGGDEFAILLPAEICRRQDDILVLAGKVLDAIREPVPLPGATLVTQASLGIAMACTGQTVGEVLRHADTAMYAAKNTHGGLVLYSAELDRGRAEKLALLADLQIGLSRDELEIHYQPQVALKSGRITGVEALVRWRHPRLGLLSPDIFVPLAETGGLIDKLTLTVLGQAVTQCQRWRDSGLDLTVAVNLSASNVTSPLIYDGVAQALADSGLPAHQLVLEITETSVMADPAQSVPALNRLVSLGVSLSLDDFGTGYSSLAYLQRLPVKEIKIDRAFVLGLADAQSASASEVLVRSIIALGASLNLLVVAEGAEDQATLETLRRLGCDLAQGYYLSRPQTAETLTPLLMADATKLVRHLSALG